MSYTGFTGQIILFAGQAIPAGWLPCDGRSVNISDYQALFSLLGTTYGGNGVQNFNLPDLRGRIPFGAGQGVGLSSHPLGQQTGSETHAISINELPPHNHALEASTQTATASTPQNGVLAAVPPNHVYYCDIPATATTTTTLPLSVNAVQMAGSNTPYDLRAPGLALNYLICVNGIYPTRS